MTAYCEPFWKVIEERLSDDSVAYNVIGRVGNYPNDALLTIGATDRAAAKGIADALNLGCSWAEVDVDA